MRLALGNDGHRAAQTNRDSAIAIASPGRARAVAGNDIGARTTETRLR